MEGCLDGQALLCDDNDKCNGVETCDAVEGCVEGQTLVCDSNDKCTEDSCNADTGCVTTPITPCCGNDVKEGDEECDDGNAVPGDGCENDCKLTIT